MSNVNNNSKETRRLVWTLDLGDVTVSVSQAHRFDDLRTARAGRVRYHGNSACAQLFAIKTSSALLWFRLVSKRASLIFSLEKPMSMNCRSSCRYSLACTKKQGKNFKNSFLVKAISSIVQHRPIATKGVQGFKTTKNKFSGLYFQGHLNNVGLILIHNTLFVRVCCLTWKLSQWGLIWRRLCSVEKPFANSVKNNYFFTICKHKNQYKLKAPGFHY